MIAVAGLVTTAGLANASAVAPSTRADTVAKTVAKTVSVPAYSAVPEFAALRPDVNAEVRLLGPQAQRYVTGRSWRPGCPIAVTDLRVVMVRYVDFSGEEREGPLLLHRTHVRKIARVMESLYAARFPIAKILPVDEYGADDDRSTLDNNTSAFNCRRAYGSKHWSRHAYGAAIDISPVQNPYVRSDGTVLDPAAQPYLDRTVDSPGVIAADGPVVRAFVAIGWGWGGNWRTIRDYQHFSANGR